MTEQKLIEQMKIKELTMQKQAHELEHKLKKEIENQIKKHEQLLIEMAPATIKVIACVLLYTWLVRICVG